MGSGSEIQQQQFRAYEAAPSHDLGGALRQQHFPEGGFFPWASLRSAPLAAAAAPPQAAILPTYLRSQQQQETPQQLLRSTSRGDDQAGAPTGNLMEMALNVRGMNVIPLAQRPPGLVLLDPEQQQQNPHQFHQLHLIQQQQLMQRSASLPAAAATGVMNISRSASLNPILQHIHQQEQQQQQQQHNQIQHQQQMLTSSSSTASGASTCKECGNQAKKDCVYQRCRTCCKSRGYECSTHVRSTWVPAAKRRERQMAEAAAIASGQPRPKSKRNRAIAMQQQQQEHQAPGEVESESQQHQLLLHQIHHHRASASQAQMIMGTVMEEELQGTTTTTTSNSPHSDARQSHSEMGGLPSEVRAQAVFKCVKVTKMVDNGEDEYAYQAVVRIGGRVFKGVLQDHGPDMGASTSISGEATSLNELQLAAAAAAGQSTVVPGGGGAGPGVTGLGLETPPQLLQQLELDPAAAASGSGAPRASLGTHGLFGSSDSKELFRES